MIKQINRKFTLTADQQTFIGGLADAVKANEWDRGTNMMIDIKQSITEQLDLIQAKKCCYCGLPLWETGRGEIDHIAPKSARVKAYSQFTFTTENLALACEFCNGSSKKGETNTIFREHVDYQHCEFKIVHPYYDNPNDHYSWINNKTQIIIRSKTWKGRYSIILFRLKDQANARAKTLMYEKRLSRIKMRNDVYEKFLRIVMFKR